MQRGADYDLALLGFLFALDQIPHEEWGPHLAAFGCTAEEAERGMEDMGQVMRDYYKVIGILESLR